MTGGKGGQGGGLARRQTGSPCLQRSVQGRLLLGESSSLAGSQVSLGGIAAKWWSQKKKTRGRDPGWGRGEVSAAPQRCARRGRRASSSAAAVWPCRSGQWCSAMVDRHLMYCLHLPPKQKKTSFMKLVSLRSRPDRRPPRGPRRRGAGRSHGASAVSVRSWMLRPLVQKNQSKALFFEVVTF